MIVNLLLESYCMELPMRKPMLTSDQLIEHLKNRGVLFNIITEEEAKTHLSQHNNYFKLSSYIFLILLYEYRLHADVFPDRAGKTPERMGCGLFLHPAVPKAEDRWALASFVGQNPAVSA